MSENNKLLSALKREGSLCFEANRGYAAAIENQLSRLKTTSNNGITSWHEGDRPDVAGTRIRQYPTGHTVFYNPWGRRFLMTDPQGHPLHECEWVKDTESGQIRLGLVRMQLDSQQWLGLKPRAKNFKTRIDIKGQQGWETMSLDDLREKAAEAWRVPFSEVKYFYKDENLVPAGDGKYDIHLQKDALYALPEGTFDRTIFISFMFQVRWEKLDLIPVVELFQSALPGSGGTTFEFIWGLYDDQSREEKLAPLRYRGLPTYPSKEAFRIFSAFFTPTGPEGENILKVFMDTNRSHEITWEPKPNPPWRYFSDTHSISLTVQDGHLYKVTTLNDSNPIPFVNCSGGGRPSCQREVRVESDSLVLVDGDLSRPIPLEPVWGITPQPSVPQLPPQFPFTWKWFFNGYPPEVDPVKAIYTLPFYPEGEAEIDESALQAMVLDQIFYYMEMSPAMPEKLEKIKRILIHTFDMVIAGCVDCTREREVTVLFGDPELAQKNAHLLWDYAVSKNQLDNLKKVSFLPEQEYVEEVYKEKYDLIFKWIPFIFFQDRDTCQKILEAVVNALEPEGILFLVGPKPIQGLFEFFSLECLYNDPVINMPFYRQHLKMCPENRVNPELVVFLAEKKTRKTEPPPPPPAPTEEFRIEPGLRDFSRPR